MSTKCSLYWDGQLHIYQECADQDNVYFERQEKDIEVNWQMNLKQVMSMTRCFNYESLLKQAAITDEQIENHVKKFVENRFRQANGIAKLSGSLIYGFVDDPEEKQIQQACDYYKKRRDVLKKLADELESGRRYWQVHFGLEEVL